MYVYETFSMETNELFIFKGSLRSLRTHGCNKLFIFPRRREAITLEGEREKGDEWGTRGNRECGWLAGRKQGATGRHRALKCHVVADESPCRLEPFAPLGLLRLLIFPRTRAKDHFQACVRTTGSCPPP